jgi:diguanylate cyclase (GGDEF)-like protein/PAS domain S-box-containing protein
MIDGASPISRATIVVAFVCSAVVLILGQAILYWRGFEQQEANDLVTHTYQVIQDLAAVKSGIDGAGTAVDLASTGAMNVSSSFDESIARARRGLANALRLTAKNPPINARLRALQPRVEQRLAMLREAFTNLPVRYADDMERRAEVQATSQVYADVNEVMRAEQSLLEMRLRASARQAEVVRNLSISAAAFSLVLVTAAFSLFNLQRRHLKELEAQRRLILNNAPIGMVIVSSEGRFMRVNHAMCQMVGYRADEMLQMSLRTITDPKDLKDDLALIRQLTAGEIKSYEVTRCYRHRAGHAVWAIVSVSLVRDDRGVPDFFVAQVQDISGRVQAEAQANLFFESSVDMLAIFSNAGTFERVNRSWSSVLGWSEDALIGHHFRDFVHPEDRDRTVAESDAIVRGDGTLGFRNRYLARDGTTRWLEWSASSIADEKLFGVARDVTKQIELEEAIRQAAILDELTGLSNRRGFTFLGEQQLRSGQRYLRPCFVLFADLDGLKRINDELGHEAGDRAIIEMAEVLRATFRSSDVVARLGGDEFVVLAEGDAQVADSLERRLQTAMQRHNTQSGREYELSASVGVAFYDQAHSCSLAEIIASADKLMYEAKRKLRASTG